MQTDLTKLRRKPFLFPLLMPIVLFAVLVAAAIWLLDARATTVVVIVRHAETGVGSEPDPDLSVVGRERAARLARMLSQTSPERGVDAIFSSELKRSQQTVTPLSENFALPVNAIPSVNWEKLPRKIRREHHGEVVVVAGHRNTIPPLVEALSGRQVTIGEDEYDAMFIVFVPQLAKSRVVTLRY